MLFLVNNRVLTQNRERTYLTSAVAAGGTLLTVKAVDSNAWANNDWIIVGEIGTPTAEILQINGSVSDGATLTIDNAGSGGARFVHNIDEPVYRIDFNKMQVYHSATVDGAKTLLATVEIQADDYESRYDDFSQASGFGFVRFLNTQTNGASPFSDAIPYRGQSQKSLSKMVEKVRALTDEEDDAFLSDGEIVDAINDRQRDIINERLWTFNEIERTDSSIEYQFEYDKPERIKTLHTARFRTEPLARVGEARWEMLHWDTNIQTTNEPTHCAVWNNKIRVYPRPSNSAANTQLNGAITASDTTINVDSTTSFKIGDYYRFAIDSEIIYATAATATSFTGCKRGQEDTTATSHLNDATVTERDIVYAGQATSVDLEQQNDETVIPEPIVICYGVAADLCKGKLGKETLGDRYELRYKEGLQGMKDRFTLKMTSQFGRVKDPREVMRDNGEIRNPNDYPQNVIAS